MSGLRVARDFDLPVETAGEAVAILAKRGAGKTNTATVLVEELHVKGVQVVVLDPVGVWWGLRGGSDGLPIPVLGGERGDVPLEPTAGALLADVAVDTGQSLVLDLSSFPHKADQTRFVTAFAERLYRRKATERSPIHLVLEEADEFAPQRVGADEAKMVGAVEALVRRGRSRGIGMTMITQRSASLNKSVLTQADTLIVMRTTGPQDRKAVESWIDMHADRDEAKAVLASLPSLATGEAWFWNPERDVLKLTKVRKRRTFDSSATPDATGAKPEPKKVAEIDLSALGEKIAETVERAQANDPAILRQRLAQAEGVVRQQAREIEEYAAEVTRLQEAVPETVEVRVEVPVLTEEESDLLAHVAKAIEGLTAQAVNIEDVGAALINQLRARTPETPPAVPSRLQTDAPATARVGAGSQAGVHVPTPGGGATSGRRASTPAPAPAHHVARSGPVAAAENGASGGGSDLTPVQQRVLDAIRWYGILGNEQPTKQQTGFIAGYRVKSNVGGTYGNILGKLRAAGLIDYPTPGTVALTAEGAALARDPGVEPTNSAVQEAVLNRLKPVEQRVLTVLIDAYPVPMSKQEAGQRSGYNVGSNVGGTFGNILGRLRSLGVIDYPSPGDVVATNVLFPLSVVR